MNSIQDLGIKTKYIYQKNAGVSSARNLGIKNSSNEWLTFLDSDDTWHKDKLQKQVDFHKNNSKILMSYTDELWVRDNKEVKIPKKFIKYGGDIFEKCLSHCIIAPSSVLISQEILVKVKNNGEVFDENLEVCEDYDLWLRISSKNKIGLIDEKLITKYAGHNDQLSFKYWGMDRFRVIALEKLLCNYGEGKPSLPKKEAAGEDKFEIYIKNGGLPTTYAKLIKKILIKKYKLLLKGAIKYDKIQEIKTYEKRLRELNE